ncbi:putative Na+/H+ antiporter [Undibacterium sp. Ren11W]|uniref:putative Na+/H+ antiporter n=1 Tax=Undibacterium sp. Ren11W TaxID=3413045 RepID=UPI003BF35FA5
MDSNQFIQYAGAAIFAVAVLHTFSTARFQHLAHVSKRHSGFWHLMGEVEVVFGFWAFVLIAAMALISNQTVAIDYLEAQNFTEPLFVFVVLTIAGTRPILMSVQWLVARINALLPISAAVGTYFLCLSLVPLLGSFITEPAAMTLAALMLRDGFYAKGISQRLKYATLGVLFVNISIGGVLTSFAAPPVLMVAEKWGWNMHFMSSVFGWKAAIAVGINALAVTMLFLKELKTLPVEPQQEDRKMPFAVTLVHYLFLGATVVFNHHPVVFMGLFLFFLGFTEAYKQYQDRLMLREGLLVAFFLAGLVVLGGKQQWWLQPIIAGMNSTLMFFGAMGLTAVTDNAALTYLGSLVEGISDAGKYALVAGAVSGGGLTVIANAPNPAGYSILKEYFDEQAIRPLGLFGAAVLPSVVAAACFLLL